MKIKTRKFIIRNLEINDAGSMAKNANSKKIWDNVRDYFPHPYFESNAIDFINLSKSIQPDTNFAIDINGKVVGVIGLVMQSDVYRKNAEIGYWLGERYWGKGIMTEAVKLLINFAFENFDLIRIYATVFETNKASRKVLEKAGFTNEAVFEKGAFKNNQFVDERRYVVFNPGLKQF